VLTYLGVPFDPEQLTRDTGFDLLRKSTQISAGVIKTLQFQFSFPMDVIMKKAPAKVSSNTARSAESLAAVNVPSTGSPKQQY
jgi:hypothetical protein